MGKIKKSLAMIALGAMTAVGVTGCNPTTNAQPMEVKEGPAADYILLKYSGGVITDVHKLINTTKPQYTQSGWHFTEENGIEKFVPGDVTLMDLSNLNQISKQLQSDKYHEYHRQFEFQSYRDKYVLPIME